MKVRSKKEGNVQKPLLGSFLSSSLYAEDGKNSFVEMFREVKYSRQRLVEILLEYNKRIFNSEKAFFNIKRISQANVFCVVSGQQIGFMGGPPYTILKAISCIQIAKEFDAVPIFWVASEDHDQSEADHTFSLDSSGSLKRFSVSLSKLGASIEDVPFTEEHRKKASLFIKSLSLPFKEWEGFFEGAERYVEVMVRAVMSLFKDFGLVFIEPKFLRELAVPFFEKELSQAEDSIAVLKNTRKNLLEAGGEVPISFDSSTNLFFKGEDLSRKKIEKKGDRFFIKKESYSLESLLNLLHENPFVFSANVAARPVLQSFVIPTIAYVAGPTEMLYFRQLKEYYRFHRLPMPWVIPRISATFITRKASCYLEKLKIDPWDDIFDKWEKNSSLPVSSHLEAMLRSWEDLALEYFDPFLVEKGIFSWVRGQSSKIERRIHKARLLKEGVSQNALHYLDSLLHPKGNRQERVINWQQFQSETGEDIVKALMDKVDWREAVHHYCYL